MRDIEVSRKEEDRTVKQSSSKKHIEIRKGKENYKPGYHINMGKIDEMKSCSYYNGKHLYMID